MSLHLRLDPALTPCRELESVGGCNEIHPDCQRRIYFEQKAQGLPAIEPIMYVIILGVPKTFELSRGWCVDLNQTRRRVAHHRTATPLGAIGSAIGYLPPIYFTTFGEDQVAFEPPPVPGAFSTTPYMVGPQWGMGPTSTLKHNQHTISKGTRASSTLGVQELHDTHFALYPQPLVRNRPGPYTVYAFQFPGAPPVDQNDDGS